MCIRDRDGAYYGYCSNGTFVFYWWTPGNCVIKGGYRGGEVFWGLTYGTTCFNGSLHNDVKANFGGDALNTIAPSCYKIVKGWY